MKFDSPLFDKVRVKPDKDRRPENRRAGLRMVGLQGNATNKAPKGKQNDKEYWSFCLKHAREYNQSYNFFKGMNDAAVLAYQKDALTGHRPTWKMGTGKRSARQDFRTMGTGTDPFGLFGEGLRNEQQKREEARPVRNAERKALTRARARGRRQPLAGQGALQGIGEAPPPGRQWWGPLDRRPADRGHQVIQLFEIGRLWLSDCRVFRLAARWRYYYFVIGAVLTCHQTEM